MRTTKSLSYGTNGVPYSKRNSAHPLTLNHGCRNLLIMYVSRVSPLYCALQLTASVSFAKTKQPKRKWNKVTWWTYLLPLVDAGFPDCGLLDLVIIHSHRGKDYYICILTACMFEVFFGNWVPSRKGKATRRFVHSVHGSITGQWSISKLYLSVTSDLQFPSTWSGMIHSACRFRPAGPWARQSRHHG